MTSIREALTAHTEACRRALAEMRPRPEWDGDPLNRADLRGANMSGANMSGANMSGANMSGANMSDANMSGANLSGANMSGANMSGANMSGANMSGADLSDAIKATAGRLRSIGSGRYDAWTAAAEGGRVLRFGCELRTIDYWRANLAALCARHESSRAAEFVAEISAILDYCDTLDRLDAADKASK